MTFTTPYTFTKGTKILSSQVNANFAYIASYFNTAQITGANLSASAGILPSQIDLTQTFSNVIASTVTLPGGSNKLVLAAATIATSNRNITFPDPGANVDMVYKTSGAAATAGGIAYGVGINTLNFSAVGTSGQFLISGAAGAPTWHTLVAGDLPNTAVTPGSYTTANITVDQQGRITAASSGASALQFAKVTLSSADILALNATPKVLYTGNAGDLLIPIAWGMMGIGGSTAYSAGSDISLYLNRAGLEQTFLQTIDKSTLTTFLPATPLTGGAGTLTIANVDSNQGTISTKSSPNISYSSTTPPVGGATAPKLQIQAAGSAFTTGNGTATAWVAFFVVTMP